MSAIGVDGPRRVIVVGCQGSGKTTLALALGRTLRLPVVHLDVLYWRPGWKESDTPSFRTRVADVIAQAGWIVDGSFSGLAFDLTLAQADLLIVIERPRWLCLWRVLWRSAFARGGGRPDLPVGCPEQFDRLLLREVWRYAIDRAPCIEAERLQFRPDVPVVRLRSDREIAAFLNAGVVSLSSPAT
ncbi:MAG: AAA family ATPase [Alphaproteobacteria bacterium]|nr:AAA family ATPase [Alphaproteobacteria bacterium]